MAPWQSFYLQSKTSGAIDDANIQKSSNEIPNLHNSLLNLARWSQSQPWNWLLSNLASSVIQQASSGRFDIFDRHINGFTQREELFQMNHFHRLSDAGIGDNLHCPPVRLRFFK